LDRSKKSYSWFYQFLITPQNKLESYSMYFLPDTNPLNPEPQPGDFNSFSQCDLAIFNQNPELVEHLVENGGIPWQLIDRFIDILHLSTSLSSTPN